MLAKLDPAANEVIRLTDAERAAFMRAVAAGARQVPPSARSQAVRRPRRLTRPRRRSACLELQVLVRREIGVPGDRRAAPPAALPTPISNAGSTIGANIARSCMSCWILCSIASRRFLSSSAGLIAVERVDVRVAAVRADPGGDHERLDAGGGIAGGRAADADEVLEASSPGPPCRTPARSIGRSRARIPTAWSR